MVKVCGQRGEVKWSRYVVRGERLNGRGMWSEGRDELVKGWGQRGEMKWSRGVVRGKK